MKSYINDFQSFFDPVNTVYIDCTKNVNSITVLSFGTIVIWQNFAFVQQISQSQVIIKGRENEVLNQVFSFNPWAPCKFVVIRKTFV